MIFDFVFTEEKILKSNFFEWLKKTMTDGGWEYLSEGRKQDDHVFFSKGENENEHIMFQIREYYSSYTHRGFHSSSYGLIGARSIYEYNQAANNTSVGTIKPTSGNGFVEYRLTPSTVVTINDYINLHYHVNKDRLILVVSTPDYHEIISSSFLVLGKPHTLARYDEFCTSTVIGSHSYSNVASRSGIYGRGSNTTVHDSLIRFNTVHRGATFGRRYASDITIHNALDGDKFIVENILVSSLSAERGIKNAVVSMRKDSFIDEQGNIYKQLPVGHMGDSMLTGGNLLLVKVGVSDGYI